MRGSRNFRQGGGPGQSDKKKALTLFFLFLFLVPSLFNRSQMVNFKEIYHFFKGQEGVQHFPGGGPTFPGGRGGGGGGGGPITYFL